MPRPWPSLHAELPSAQLLPPNQPGYSKDHNPYRLADADLARARALMRGRHFTARLAIATDCDACRQWAQTVQHQLAAIGITIDIEAASHPQAAARRPNASFDLIETSTVQDFADPSAFLTTMIGRDIPHSWLPASVHSDLIALRQQTGPDRTAAAGALARRLATTDVPATSFAHQVNGQFFSPRLACRTFPTFGYGVDLAALCLGQG